MRSSEVIQERIVKAQSAVGHDTRQFPDKLKGIQDSIMAKMRRVRELGFNPGKNFNNDIRQIQYNDWIDESLKWYNFIMNNLPK